MKIYKYFSLIILLTISINGFAFGKEYFCHRSNLTDGTCKKGDAMIANTANQVLKYCDFDKPIVAVGDGKAVCAYIGYKKQSRTKK